jgi:hypothetical protein
LVEAFDQIPLLQILETMRGLEFFRKSDVSSALGQIVRNKVRRILFPPHPVPVRAPSTRERIAADKRATAAARTKTVERNIALGRRLAELRDSMPSNRKFGVAVRKLGHDDPLHVAEVMRVARRYGDRPEIFSNVSWHALTELASSATSEAEV